MVVASLADLGQAVVDFQMALVRIEEDMEDPHHLL